MSLSTEQSYGVWHETHHLPKTTDSNCCGEKDIVFDWAKNLTPSCMTYIVYEIKLNAYYIPTHCGYQLTEYLNYESFQSSILSVTLLVHRHNGGKVNIYIKRREQSHRFAYEFQLA